MTTDDVSPQLLTTREAAAQLRVNWETILRWIRAGKMPAVKLPGGALRIDPEQVDGLRPPTPPAELEHGSIEYRLDAIERHLVHELEPRLVTIERKLKIDLWDGE
jgi:excisionase family DNA binding protein